jgi:H+/Na+-translocating ferredoxin:NAD+ oxidoreductase subunit G
MRNILKISGKLALICAVAAIALAFVNQLTAPKIEEYNKEKLIQALSAVSKNYTISEASIMVNDVDSETNSEFSNVNEYYTLTENGTTVGYILSVTANGYGGPMGMIIGYEINGEIIQARLLKNAETPGLGKEAEKSEYMEVFLSKGASDPIPQRKNQLPADIVDAISGATITFSGVAKALYSGSEFVKTHLSDSNK